MNEAFEVAQNFSTPALVKQLVVDRVELILGQTVVEYYNGKITPKRAYAAIAQIAGLRLLVSDLQSRIQSAEKENKYGSAS